MKLSLSEKVKALMAQSGIKQEALAKLVGVKQQSIAKIVAGQTKKPKFIVELAGALKTTPEWLLFDKGKSPFDPSTTKIPEAHCPIIPWSRVMDWLSGNREAAVSEMQGTIPSFNASHNGYALRIESESMINDDGGQRTFLPGTVIIVDPEVKPKSKSFIVISRDSKEPILRQYVKEGGEIRIKPLDPTFDPFYLTETDKILGVVVAHIDLMD